MKYKVNDQVKIRTWESMEKEYGLDFNGDINGPSCYIFFKSKEEAINEEYPDRILTITKIGNRNNLKYEYYEVKELSSDWAWHDYMIESLAEKPIAIHTRFEILDL